MLGDDEDVFDSVTWESAAAAPTYDTDETISSGPGFRQSTTDSEGPHDPKWEGYLITTVKDPVKELAETKDAYVSYLVQARVSILCLRLTIYAQYTFPRRTYQYSPLLIQHLVADSRTLSS